MRVEGLRLAGEARIQPTGYMYTFTDPVMFRVFSSIFDIRFLDD